MEKGLSFFEFNYMLMQGLWFLSIKSKRQIVTMQLGGDDQWSNMIAGMDLIRRKSRKTSIWYDLLLFLTNSEGKKWVKQLMVQYG